ncbi:MAG: hypothetical protein D6763_10630 [Alphaproteobacteria bacterium]|nr:MAG: hypothetical protein D6763_10630 [Alphaproteobacteria bacterium]
MWKVIPLEWKGVIVGVLAGAVLTLIGIERARAAEATVFDLYDRAVMTLVATAECGTVDSSDYNRFTSGFARVYDAVEAELLAMNPGKTRDDLQMVIGFRTRFLEQRVTTAVATAGCEAEEVQKLAELFDINQRLSMMGSVAQVH